MGENDNALALLELLRLSDKSAKYGELSLDQAFNEEELKLDMLRKSFDRARKEASEGKLSEGDEFFDELDADD